MNWDALQAFAELTAALVAAWAFWHAYKSAKENRRASELEVFIAFSDKYENLKKSRTKTYSTFKQGGTLTREEMQYAYNTLKYFEKQHYFWVKKLVSPSLWQLWEPKIVKFINQPATQYAWSQRAQHAKGHHDFSTRFETYFKESTK